MINDYAGAWNYYQVRGFPAKKKHFVCGDDVTGTV